MKTVKPTDNTYRELLYSVPVAIFRSTLGGELLDANPELVSLLGFRDRETLLAAQQDLPSLFHLAGGFAALLDTGVESKTTGEGVVARSDGSVLAVKWVCRPEIPEGGGQPVFNGVITELESGAGSYEELRHSREMLSAVLESIPQYIFWKDRNLVYQGCNWHFARSAGVERPEDICGKTDWDLPWSEEEKVFYRECDRRVMDRDEAEYNILETQLCADGTSLHLRTNKIPLHDATGEVIGILGTYEDITKRLEVENQLRMMEQVVESSPVTVIRWRAEEGWPIEFVSGNVDQFGYSSTELMSGQVLFSTIVHPDDLESAEKAVAEDAARGIANSFREYRIKTGDGRVRWVEARTIIVRDTEGEVSHYQGILIDSTESKQAEESLKLFRSVIENSTGIVGIARLEDMRHTYINPAGLALLGYDSLVDVPDREVLDFHPAGEREWMEEKVMPEVRSNGFWKGENRLLRADGTTFPVEQSLFIVENAAGLPTYMATFMEDTSRHKKSLEAIRLNEARLETLVALGQMSGAGYELLADFTMEKAIKLTGSEVAFLVCVVDGRADCWRPGGEAGESVKHRVAMDELFSGGSRRRNPVLRNVNSSSCRGEDGWPANLPDAKRYMVIPVYEGARLTLVAGVANKATDYEENDLHQLALLLQGMQSIVKQKRDHEVLQIGQELLAEARTLAGITIWEYDSATGDLEWPQQIAENLGIDSQEARADYKTILKRIHPEDIDRFKDAVQRSLAGERVQFEYRAIKDDGQTAVFLSTGKTIFDEDGQPKWVIGVGYDISELKSIEEELRQHRDNLEQLVAERTAELAAAKEQAESASASRAAFFANMSHELRTPLNSILGFSRLLSRDSDITEGQREKLSLISKSGENLLALISDVLDMSKIEADRFEENPEDFGIVAFLSDLTEIYHVHAAEKGVAYVFKNEIDDLVVRCDKGKLRQILINLLGNAVKFTDEGRIELVAALDTCESGGIGELDIRVKDTGVGISGQQIQTIFEPFTQAESRTSESGGTGLGLAISRKFALGMGGDLTVRSVVGYGTEFVLRIPVVCCGPGNSQKIDERMVTGIANETPCRILIAEDNPMSRLFLSELLKSVGVEVKEAVNGDEAVRLFRSWEPDIVLMDIRMPVMDGLEAARIIKSSDSGKDTPVVALTAQAFREDIQDIMAAGFDEFVAKPFNEEKLFDLISTHLGVEWVYGGTVSSSAVDSVDPLPEYDLSDLLDFEGGLRRTLGDRELYCRMLRMFVENYRAADSELTKMLEVGEREAAAFFIHSLKGAAVTVAAPALSEEAQVLETMLRSGEGELDGACLRFTACLHRTFVVVEEYLEGRECRDY